MNKFTAGPWTRSKYGNIVDGNGVDIIFRGVSTLCSGSDERTAMAEANSNLTAAAPDLFKELQLVIDYEEQGKFEQWLQSKSPHGDCDSVQAQWLDSSEYEDFCDLWSGPIAAIAKALAPQ